MKIEKLGDKTRSEIVRQVQKHLDVYAGELNAAYIMHKDEKFAISFKATVERVGEDNKVTVGISFRPEPDMKDEDTGFVNEDQMELFEDLKEGESVTISNGARSVTINGKK